jgi:hypothetical protein
MMPWPLVRLWLRFTLGELRCGCHWRDPYGAVVMAGCPKHD